MKFRSYLLATCSLAAASVTASHTSAQDTLARTMPTQNAAAQTSSAESASDKMIVLYREYRGDKGVPEDVNVLFGVMAEFRR